MAARRPFAVEPAVVPSGVPRITTFGAYRGWAAASALTRMVTTSSPELDGVCGSKVTRTPGGRRPASDIEIGPNDDALRSTTMRRSAVRPGRTAMVGEARRSSKRRVKSLGGGGGGGGGGGRRRRLGCGIGLEGEVVDGEAAAVSREVDPRDVRRGHRDEAQRCVGGAVDVLPRALDLGAVGVVDENVDLVRRLCRAAVAAVEAHLCLLLVEADPRRAAIRAHVVGERRHLGRRARLCLGRHGGGAADRRERRRPEVDALRRVLLADDGAVREVVEPDDRPVRSRRKGGERQRQDGDGANRSPPAQSGPCGGHRTPTLPRSRRPWGRMRRRRVLSAAGPNSGGAGDRAQATIVNDGACGRGPRWYLTCPALHGWDGEGHGADCGRG